MLCQLVLVSSGRRVHAAGGPEEVKRNNNTLDEA